MWRCILGLDLPNRFGKEHISAKLSDPLQRREGQEGSQNTVLQQEDVPRTGCIDGTKLCCELDFLFCFRIYQEADKFHRGLDRPQC